MTTAALLLPIREVLPRPRRLPQFAYIGPNIYFLTICAELRRPLFADPDVALKTLEEFRRTALEDRFAILAYCLMPDHLHLLVQGTAVDSDFKRFVRLGKQRSAFRHSVQTAGGSLWQEGYYERVLRTEEDVRAMARYVIENPVRAGLVASASDYAFVGSDVWTVAAILDADRRT